jgi:hypothetical protein
LDPGCSLDRGILEDRANGEGQPVGPVLVGTAAAGHERYPPAGQCFEGGAEGFATVGQLVPRVVVVGDHAFGLEQAQALRKEVDGDPGKAFAQVAETARPRREFPDDQQRPPIADDVEGSREGAELAIAAHASIVVVDFIKLIVLEIGVR